MKKRTKELIILIPLLVVLSVTMVIYFIQQEAEPQTHTGLFVEYKGEMIGGDIQGNLIILENGTKMGLDEFKRITGYNP